MSEFQLSFDHGVQNRDRQAQGSAAVRLQLESNHDWSLVSRSCVNPVDWSVTLQVDWYQPSAESFSSADFGQTALSTSAGAFGTFEDEEPLLQGRLRDVAELGIDIPAILRRSRGILLNRLGANEMLSLDLGGPLFFALLLASVHLLAGKLHFGVILGWTVVASMAVWFVVNNLAGVEAGHSRGLGLYDCCCLLGYCQVPILLHGVIALALPRGVWRAALALMAAFWSAWMASKLFAYRSQALREQFYLVLYPCLLTFTAFAILTVY